MAELPHSLCFYRRYDFLKCLRKAKALFRAVIFYAGISFFFRLSTKSLSR